MFLNIKRAQANFYIKKLGEISEAGESGHQYWMANAWLLERLRPDLYGKREGQDTAVQQGVELLERLANILRPSTTTIAIENPKPVD